MSAWAKLALRYFPLMLMMSLVLSDVQENSAKQSILRQKRGWLYNIVADGCKGAGRLTGWACDDPVSRKLWQAVKNCRGCSCDQYCKKASRPGGRCVAARNYDHSTWCPRKGDACHPTAPEHGPRPNPAVLSKF